MLKEKKKKRPMKQNGRHMYVHLHENTDESHNMFEGYYGRRRLKNTIAIFLCFLILIALVYQQHGKIVIN
jgi:hypothetical protein